MFATKQVYHINDSFSKIWILERMQKVYSIHRKTAIAD